MVSPHIPPTCTSGNKVGLMSRWLEVLTVGWSPWGDLNPSGRSSFCRVESERYTVPVFI